MTSVTARRHNDVQRAEVVLLRRGAEISRWSLDTAARLDLATVDHLARTQLCAHRLGCVIRLERVCPALRGLLDLCGLTDW